jgi:hypothetical protein
MADATPTPKPLCFVIGPIGEGGSPERGDAADALFRELVRRATRKP